MTTSLAQHLREAGYRLTAPRLAVLQVLEAERQHLSPNEVLQRGRLLHPRLSRATVYRTLELLTGLGALRPIYEGGSARVACVDGGHHHLICLGCGTAVHFDKCLLDGLEQELAEQWGFQKISSHLLELYGLCPDCCPHARTG